MPITIAIVETIPGLFELWCIEKPKPSAVEQWLKSHLVSLWSWSTPAAAHHKQSSTESVGSTWLYIEMRLKSHGYLTPAAVNPCHWIEMDEVEADECTRKAAVQSGKEVGTSGRSRCSSSLSSSMYQSLMSLENLCQIHHHLWVVRTVYKMVLVVYQKRGSRMIFHVCSMVYYDMEAPQ